MRIKPLVPLVVCALVVAAIPDASSQTRPAPKSAAPAKPAPTQEVAPVPAGLTNSDIIKMVQAGLGETVVLSAIRTAPKTSFQLDPDNLIALKKSGVSDAIVSVMLDPKAAPAPASVAVAMPMAYPGGAPDTRARVSDPSAPVEVPRDPGIYVDLGADTPNLVALEPTTFSQGKTGSVFASALTYGIKKMKWKAVVRSKNANFRMRQGTPVFYFYFEQRSSGLGATGGFTGWLSGATSPNEFVLAKMDVKSKERELIVGEFGAFGSSTGTRSKDTVEFMVEKLSGGAYRVKPVDPMPPGEYSFFYAAGASTFGGSMVGKLFDFGIDPLSSAKD